MIDLSKPIMRKRRGFTPVVQSLDRQGFWIALAALALPLAVIAGLVLL